MYRYEIARGGIGALARILWIAVASLVFFPQYYRFLLSIALDLEDLGMPGDVGEVACAWAAKEGLAEAELSDLQRGEARRLLARRGHGEAKDAGLDDRLRAFVSRAGTFSLPNKKAAYELTHIVFYLSEYGRRDPMLPESAIVSLEYAGMLAMLEQNMDLLAEVCIALRYAGQVPNPGWEGRILRNLRYFALGEREGSVVDDYHEYMVSCWAALAAGEAGTSQQVSAETGLFRRTSDVTKAPLLPLSSALYALDRARSGNWIQMRGWVYDQMDAEQQAILAEVEASSPYFESFFEGFARAQACA